MVCAPVGLIIPELKSWGIISPYRRGNHGLFLTYSSFIKLLLLSFCLKGPYRIENGAAIDHPLPVLLPQKQFDQGLFDLRRHLFTKL